MHAELCNILLTYRKTIHPASGKSPLMMLFNRQIRSRLDLMVHQPADAAKLVEGKVRDLPEGVRVAARDYIDRTKWKYGVITEKLGKLHYYVLLDDGRTWKRHIDQLREVGSSLLNERPVPATVCPEETEEPPQPAVPAQASTEPAPTPAQSPHQQPIPAMPPPALVKGLSCCFWSWFEHSYGCKPCCHPDFPGHPPVTATFRQDY